MRGPVVFVLPSGRSTELSEPSARLICDRLWDLGIVAGAATAAAGISEVLHTHPAFRPEVMFSRREVTPLIEAAQAHPRTWTLLLEDADFSAFSAAQRKLLLQVSEELIGTLHLDRDQYKVRVLIADIERLRDNLRAAG
jgi:hypothetical protein